MKSSSILSVILLAAATVIAMPNAHKGHSGSGTPPTNPGSCTQCVSSPNNCDITAPCANFVDVLYCACRPGYKAGQYADSDTSKQWRVDTLPGHEHRVWVAPGVVCDDLCDNPWGPLPCGEVAVSDSCAPH